MNCATAIRKELKNKFPNINFSVRTRRNAIDVEYYDAVPSSKIEEVVSKYELGHFDGMDDSYKYTNVRNDIPQVQYVMVNRHISNDIKSFPNEQQYFIK